MEAAGINNIGGNSTGYFQQIQVAGDQNFPIASSNMGDHNTPAVMMTQVGKIQSGADTTDATANSSPHIMGTGNVEKSGEFLLKIF